MCYPIRGNPACFVTSVSSLLAKRGALGCREGAFWERVRLLPNNPRRKKISLVCTDDEWVASGALQASIGRGRTIGQIDPLKRMDIVAKREKPTLDVLCEFVLGVDLRLCVDFFPILVAQLVAGCGEQ